MSDIVSSDHRLDFRVFLELSFHESSEQVNGLREVLHEFLLIIKDVENDLLYNGPIAFTIYSCKVDKLGHVENPVIIYNFGVKCE